MGTDARSSRPAQTELCSLEEVVTPADADQHGHGLIVNRHGEGLFNTPVLQLCRCRSLLDPVCRQSEAIRALCPPVPLHEAAPWGERLRQKAESELVIRQETADGRGDDQIEAGKPIRAAPDLLIVQIGRSRLRWRSAFWSGSRIFTEASTAMMFCTSGESFSVTRPVPQPKSRTRFDRQVRSSSVICALSDDNACNA